MYIRAGVVVGVLAGVLAPTDSFKQAGLLLRGNVCLQPFRAYRFLQMCTHTDMNTAVQSADHFEEFTHTGNCHNLHDALVFPGSCVLPCITDHHMTDTMRQFSVVTLA